VTLIKAGSVTHSFNMEQRFMALNFTRTADTLNVAAPDNKNLAPPGLYMLFVLDADGAPSVGKLVWI
jgi:hypothetical protein